MQLIEKLERDMALQYSLDDSCIFSDDESCQEIDAESEKRQRLSPAPRKLVTFCATRWYSAWMVMSVLYSLRDTIEQLKNECRNGYGGTKGKILLCQLQQLNWEYVEKLLHYLRPLVQGIDFCQKDTTTALDVKQMWDNLYYFYVNNTGVLSEGKKTGIEGMIDLEEGSVDKVFAGRRELLNVDFPRLRSLF